MEEKDAKKICSLPLGKGTLKGDEAWILSNRVTDKSIAIKTRTSGLKVKQYKDKETSQVLFEDHTLDWEGKYTVRKDKDGNVLFKSKAWRGGGYESIYLYTTQPAFEGQEASEERLAKDDDTDLYVFARLTAIKEFSTRSVLFSYCKGLDTDNETGFGWKDLYRGYKKPQFTYSATVVDMEGNVVCKSQQENLVDNRAVYEVAPGADMVAVTAVCYPILPDGIMLAEGIDLATWFLPEAI